jgi:hypothetical protein
MWRKPRCGDRSLTFNLEVSWQPVDSLSHRAKQLSDPRKPISPKRLAARLSNNTAETASSLLDEKTTQPLLHPSFLQRAQKYLDADTE